MDLSAADLLKVYGRPLGLRLLAGERGSIAPSTVVTLTDRDSR